MQAVRRVRLWRVAAWLAFLAAAAPAGAAQFCVQDQAGIVAAFDAADSNGQNDDVRIVAGTIALTTHLQYYSAEANSIAVSGGWNANCSLRNGGSTVLDGGFQYWILRMYSSAASAMVVTDIGFHSGRVASGSNPGGGLSIQSSGDITIERNRFLGNESTYSTGGLSAGAGGKLTVRNNLLVGNSAPYFGAAQLICNGAEATVTGNTIAGNSATAADANGGVHVGGAAHFTLGNNIIRDNTNWDLSNQAQGGLTLTHNDIGPHYGQPIAPDSAGNVDVDPQFASGLLNFRLSAASPLVNAGTDAPPGGLGIYAVDGEPRRQGAHVDIGAYETDVLFFSGMDPRPATWP